MTGPGDSEDRPRYGLHRPGDPQEAMTSIGVREQTLDFSKTTTPGPVEGSGRPGAATPKRDKREPVEAKGRPAAATPGLGVPTTGHERA